METFSEFTQFCRRGNIERRGRHATGFQFDQILPLLHRPSWGTQSHDAVIEKWQKQSKIIRQIIKSVQCLEISEAIRRGLAPDNINIVNTRLPHRLSFLLPGDVVDTKRRQATQISILCFFLGVEQLQFLFAKLGDCFFHRSMLLNELAKLLFLSHSFLFV